MELTYRHQATEEDKRQADWHLHPLAVICALLVPDASVHDEGATAR